MDILAERFSEDPEARQETRRLFARKAVLSSSCVKGERIMADKKDVKFQEEIKKMEYEPLDETELKLIRGGIILGLVLLAVLFVISKYLMPGVH